MKKTAPKRNTFDRHVLSDLGQLRQQLSAQQKRDEQRAQAERERVAAEQAAREAHSPNLFRQAVQGVKPLVAEPSAIAPTRKPTRPDAQILAKRAAAMGSTVRDEAGLSDTQAMLNPVASEAFLSFRQATLPHRQFDQLKSAKLRWFEAVDLHGCTVEQARAAVLQVIDMARADNQTVVKIVHGKGPSGILKTCVNGWLRQHREVLAFVSAPPEQGGTGAVLVLLKRTERPNTPD